MLGMAAPGSFGLLGSRSNWTGSQTDGSKMALNPQSSKKNEIYNGIDYDSSAIQSIKWDPNTQNAKVVWTGSSKEYDYPMTEQEFNNAKWSGSKGQYMNQARTY